MTGPTVLELRGIVKSFGSVQALRGADFVLGQGEIHALLGENGAGKSTLMQIAYGMLEPDAGSIRVASAPVRPRSPRAARALGIGMVHQHFTSIGTLTVRENLELARGSRTEQAARRPVAPLAEELLAGLRLGARVESLGVALRQRLEVAKALATGARILLLDEPSAVLAPSEVDELLGILRRFTAAGGSVVLITHKLREVFAGANRVTVLRQGRTVWSGTVTGPGALATAALADAMLGTAPERRAAAGPEPPSLAYPLGDHPSPPAPLPGEPVVRIGELAIQSGELVGIAAIEGNGQREILRRLAGIAEGSPPATDVRAMGPVAFVPEDRTLEGLIPTLSLTENLVLGLERDSRWTRGPRLDWARARAHATWVLWNFGIRAPGPDAKARTLSGGNQQKLILARALESGPRVLVAENPTRGLDLRATAEVHRRLRAAAEAGVTVLVYSTDLDEVLELARRILVVHAGRVLEAPAKADRRTVGALMLGIDGQQQ